MASLSTYDYERIQNDAWLDANDKKEQCPYCPPDKPLVHPNNWDKHMRLYHSEMLEPLNYTEARAFLTHEAVIERGLEMFYAVGDALAKIRDGRLYREKYRTFEQYCKERWQMTRQRGYQLIQAAGVVENLSKKFDIDVPTTTAHASALSGLEPDEQRVVWEVVKQTAPKGKVTAQHIKSVVNVCKDLTVSGAIDDGTGEQIEVSQVAKAAIIEETYERMKRQEIHIAEGIARKEAKLTTPPPPVASEPTAAISPSFSIEQRGGIYVAVMVIGEYETFAAAEKAIAQIKDQLAKDC